jgi:hypothetical protein
VVDGRKNSRLRECRQRTRLLAVIERVLMAATKLF